MSVPPSFEQWRATMADMVLFHQEQGLPWLWLPTPSEWIDGLHAQESIEQALLRTRQVMPSTPQPLGLSWYAWDTREDAWVHNDILLTSWYTHWAHAQSA